MHVNNYSSSDREVIRFLFSSSDWCDLYELHTKFSLSPAQVVDIIERLKSAHFVEVHGVRARLTQDGRTWVIAARDFIFFGHGDEDWKHYNQQISSLKLDVMHPYLPDLGIIDRGFFLKLALDLGENDVKD